MKSLFISALLLLSTSAFSQIDAPLEAETQAEAFVESESEELLPELPAQAAGPQASEPLAAKPQVIQGDQINVDGVLPEKKVTDGELETIKQEIQKQKTEVVLNKEKAKSYQELKKSVEALSETTEEYLSEKNEAKEQIAEYNLKVKCLQEEHPGKECDKHVRRKK